MKRTLKLILPSAFCLLTLASAYAADISLYYSPTCPHCHHARAFLNDELLREYPGASIDAWNVAAPGNMDVFRDVVKKCEFDSGAVPVIVAGEKCFQGYAPFMNGDIRAAANLSDDKKSANADTVIVERIAGDDVAQKKTKSGDAIYFYVILAALVAGLGFVLLRKKK